MGINSFLSLGKGSSSASPSPDRPYGTKGPDVPTTNPADGDSEHGTIAHPHAHPHEAKHS